MRKAAETTPGAVAGTPEWYQRPAEPADKKRASLAVAPETRRLWRLLAAHWGLSLEDAMRQGAGIILRAHGVDPDASRFDPEAAERRLSLPVDRTGAESRGSRA
jgi:hypothetical protein